MDLNFLYFSLLYSRGGMYCFVASFFFFGSVFLYMGARRSSVVGRPLMVLWVVGSIPHIM